MLAIRAVALDDTDMVMESEANQPLTENLETYLDWAEEQDSVERGTLEGGEPEEKVAENNTGDGGESRVKYLTDFFPGDAGFPIQQGLPKFFQMRQEHANSTVHPSLHPSTTWQLARWLMSGGLSASARDEFFKLKLVSTNLIETLNLLINVLRMMGGYPGGMNTNSRRPSILSLMGQNGVVLSMQYKEIWEKKWSKYGCEIQWSVYGSSSAIRYSQNIFIMRQSVYQRLTGNESMGRCGQRNGGGKFRYVSLLLGY